MVNKHLFSASFARLAATFALLGVSACTTGSLEELRTTQARGTAFQSALSKLYLAYSESEALQYDWWSSKYFADKGLSAAYGKDTPPEIVEEWDISPNKAGDLAKGRSALLEFLQSGITQTDPERAAYAQFYYDCWMEQEKDGWQMEDINACKQGFVESLKPEEVKKSIVEPTISTSYLVFFKLGSFVITPEGIKVLEAVMRDLNDPKNSSSVIVLNGHADRLGTDAYNRDLSQKRADIVKKHLIKRGVSPKHMQLFAFGETDPRIPTKDGVAEPANRRVEIFFNQ